MTFWSVHLCIKQDRHSLRTIAGKNIDIRPGINPGPHECQSDALPTEPLKLLYGWLYSLVRTHQEIELETKTVSMALTICPVTESSISSTVRALNLAMFLHLPHFIYLNNTQKCKCGSLFFYFHALLWIRSSVSVATNYLCFLSTILWHFFFHKQHCCCKSSF